MTDVTDRRRPGHSSNLVGHLEFTKMETRDLPYANIIPVKRVSRTMNEEKNG